MSGTRALFASIGASVSLVAAAALSLLAVSAVFAFGGWSAPVAESVRQSALVLTADAAPKRATAATPVKLPAPMHSARASRSSSSPARSSRTSSLRANAALDTGRSARTHGTIGAVTSPELTLPDEPAAKQQSPPPPAKKAGGDGVRTAGDDLSGAVQSTGSKLGQVTDALLPPVTTAVQTVVNILAALLRRTTNGVAGALDGVLPAK